MPRCSSSRRNSPPCTSRLACARLIVRPAPWQVEPKLWAIDPSVPTSTQLAVPIEPGTSTGWPMSR